MEPQNLLTPGACQPFPCTDRAIVRLLIFFVRKCHENVRVGRFSMRTGLVDIDPGRSTFSDRFTGSREDLPGLPAFRWLFDARLGAGIRADTSGTAGV